MPAPPVEAGRLHEVLGGGGAGGLGVALGWLAGGESLSRCCAWIGRAAWPASTALDRTDLLDDALLIDARTPAERAWAAELCVKCEAVAAVVADGRGLDLTMTRRLQLAARGRDCRLIVLRPGGEAGSSAAGSRWTVRPVEATTDAATGDPPRWPRWGVELVKRKGGHEVADGGTATSGKSRRPAGLRTAGEMFCDEATAPTTGVIRHDRLYEWHPHQGRGLPVDPPADVAGGSPVAPMVWTG